MSSSSGSLARRQPRAKTLSAPCTKYVSLPYRPFDIVNLNTTGQDMANVVATLQADITSTRELRARVDQTVQDTIAATQIVDGFRNPQQHGAHLKTRAGFPFECVHFLYTYAPGSWFFVPCTSPLLLAYLSEVDRLPTAFAFSCPMR